MSSYVFNGEEDWLERTQRAIIGYLSEVLLVGSQTYKIVSGFPADDLFRQRMPLDDVLIHVDIDDIQNPIFGFGDNVIVGFNQYDIPNQYEVTEVEAQQHVVNFDLGVWATERAGGETARLKVYQRLTHALAGTEAYSTFAERTGVQIQSFDGGQFIMETINDIKVWRVAGMTLVVQVFNKRFRSPVPYIESIASDGVLHIDDTVIVDE